MKYNRRIKYTMTEEQTNSRKGRRQVTCPFFLQVERVLDDHSLIPKREGKCKNAAFSLALNFLFSR